MPTLSEQAVANLAYKLFRFLQPAPQDRVEVAEESRRIAEILMGLHFGEETREAPRAAKLAKRPSDVGA